MTHEQKAQFLDLLKTMSASKAAHVLHLSDSRVYRARHGDPAFEAAWRRVNDHKDAENVDGMKRRALSRAEIAERRRAGLKLALEKYRAAQKATPDTMRINGCVLTRKDGKRCGGLLTCQHYDQCLNAATDAEHNWPGWIARPA